MALVSKCTSGSRGLCGGICQEVCEADSSGRDTHMWASAWRKVCEWPASPTQTEGGSHGVSPGAPSFDEPDGRCPGFGQGAGLVPARGKAFRPTATRRHVHP